MNDGEKLAYTLPDLAKARGCSVSTLYRRAEEGRLKIRKDGGKSIVLAEDARADLNSLPVLKIKRARKKRAA